MPLNFYMLWLFLDIFRYFLQRRGDDLTSYNRRVIKLVYVLWLSYVVQVLISTVVFTISLLTKFRSNEEVMIPLKYLMGPLHWTL